MSMSALAQLGVEIAMPFSILQVKKHSTRNMEQNADIEKCKPNGSRQRHGANQLITLEDSGPIGLLIAETCSLILQRGARRM